MRYRTESFSARGGGSAIAREPATLLVATDGTADSDHALEFAKAFTREDDAAVHVISVCEAGPDPVAWPGLVSLPMFHDAGIVENGRRAAVRSQVARIAGDRGYWPITVASGGVAMSIAKSAKDVGANLIVTGRGRHDLGDRLLGEEHLLRLIREATVPVLAADDSLRAPPSRIAIGVDFGESQRAVAQGAARWAADDAMVFLVHARPAHPRGVADAEEWYQAYDDRARLSLDALAHELDYPGGATFEARLIDGHPGMGLSHFCANEDCDLVVAGAQGTGFVHRLVVGSVTTYLLRHASCSLLAIPGD